jgi:hypothetical protein
MVADVPGNIEVARLMSGLTGDTEHVYSETRYAAGSWKRERRIIIKAEVVRLGGKAPRDNPRFIVTNMSRARSGSMKKSTVSAA